MSWSKSELRARLALLNRFKPSSKIFYWPFKGSTSFVDLFFCCFFSVLCLLCFCARLFICALSHLFGKGWPLGTRLWCLTVSLSLSHWYPGSGVVLDCINPWSLHPFLLLTLSNISEIKSVEYVHKRVSFGSKDCTKELKPECAYFVGQTS